MTERPVAADPDGRGASPPRRPALHGRLVGSLPGAQAGAASVAVLREHASGTVIAQARIAPDGSFAMAELPSTVRRKAFTLEVTVAGGATPAVSLPVDLPGAGDATVVVDQGTFATGAGSLSPVPEALDPTRLDEVLTGYAQATAAFARTRQAARGRQEQVDVDWFGSSGYLERVRRPGQGSEHYVPSGNLMTFDREIVFRRPSAGLREAQARTRQAAAHRR